MKVLAYSVANESSLLGEECLLIVFSHYGERVSASSLVSLLIGHYSHHEVFTLMTPSNPVNTITLWG